MREPATTRRGGLDRAVPLWIGRVFDLLGVALLGVILWCLVQRNYRTQMDLEVYYQAGRAVLAGLDPYTQSNLIEIAGGFVYPFVYPPVALLPCMALAFMPWLPLALTWMWLKVGLLALLVPLWSKWFNRQELMLPIALLAIFGSNGSAHRDLVVGNIAILEATLVWAGLAAYVAGRRSLFACLIVLAASFKLAPAAFLLLLLAKEPGRAPQWRTLAVSVLVFATIVFGPMLVGPAAQFRSFWSGVPNWTVDGAANPTVIGFVFALTDSAGLTDGIVPQQAVVLWLVYCAALVGLSWPFLKRCADRRDPRLWVMTAAFLYTLMMPRPTNYGFIILTPAVLYFSPAPFQGAVGRWILALIISAQGLFRWTSIDTTSPLSAYATFLLNLSVWMLVLNDNAKVDRLRSEGVVPSSPELAKAT